MSAAPSTLTVEKDEPILETLVTAVAEAENVDPLALAPVYSVIDPEVLDRLLATGTGAVTVELRYSGYEVTIKRTEHVTVTLEAISTTN